MKANLENCPQVFCEEIDDEWERCRKQDMRRLSEWLEDFEASHKFLVAMDERVEEKQEEYGNSWKTVSISFLTERVRRNYEEWLDTYDSPVEYERQKLVDLANLCRFLWERLGEEE